MKNNKVSLVDMYDIMVEMLASGKTVTFNPAGRSMLPTIHDKDDRIVLTKVIEPLKRYDLPLYRRDNGQFILHRVISVNTDGTYNMCGDNQWTLERGINHDQIIGLVIKIERRGKEFSVDNWLYKFYVKIWVAIMPLRHLVIGGIQKVKKILALNIYKPPS